LKRQCDLQSQSLHHASSVPLNSQKQDLSFEHRYQKWLRNFKASDPAYQGFCENFFSRRGDGKAQFGQDAFVFFNFFAHMPVNGMKGTYIDSGANSAEELSNSFVFDKCLGWKGLCIEPNIQYHADLKSKRSCTVVPKCISDQSKSVGFDNAGPLGQISSNIVPNVQCSTFSEILEENRFPKSIDFWSLDVEGHEMQVLNSINFQDVEIKVLLVEDFWISNRELDFLMNKKSYIKHQQLAIDSVYVPRSKFDSSKPVWYPTKYFDHINSNNEFRKQQASKLKCI
jgi:FkbM family methyltransferase